MKTGKGELSKEMVPTSDVYLEDEPHYAHIITAMAAMTNAGLEVQVYLGTGRFCAYPTSSIRIYTTAAQRDDDAVWFDKIVRLEGALMSAKVFEMYSDLMGNPGDALHRDNLLAAEMEVEPSYSMWD